MKAFRETLTIHTEQNQEFVDITKQVRDVVTRSGIQNGILVLNSLHTTMALFVNETQSALLNDLAALLQKLVPRRDGYYHDNPRYSDCDRGNAHAHMRSILLGRTTSLPVADGVPVLGQYESLIAAELDGPRERMINLQAIGE